MYHFSQGSKDRLNTLHPDLQFLLHKAIMIMDFSVTWGVRNETEQNTIFEKGASKLQYPDSKHNKEPSQAVDIDPYPIDYKDVRRYYILAGIMKALAKEHNIKIRWGGDWDSDNDLTDQTFNDLAHFELV